MSSRPTGYSRSVCGTSVTTVGRPCGSRAVDTTPAGLLSAYMTRSCTGVTGAPSSATASPGPTSRAGSVTGTRRDRDPAGADDLLAGAARGHPAVARYLASRMFNDCRGAGGAATIVSVDLKLLERQARRARRAPLPRRPGVALGGPRRRRLRRHVRPAAQPARDPGGGGAVQQPVSRARGPRARRDRQGAVLDRRRPPGRGGADALPGRPALDLPVLAVGLPADVHVLRHRADEVRAQPDRLGDPRPGAPLPQVGRDHPPGRHAPRASTTPCSWAWASR